MDIVVWLRSLGLEQYEAIFRKNEIDESVLPDLTEDHLRELGFPLGARLKILKAIAALGKHAEAISPSADSATSPTVPRLTPEDRAVLSTTTSCWASGRPTGITILNLF